MTSVLKQKLALSVQVTKNPNHHKCIVAGCPSLEQRTRVRYFRLPSDEKRRNLWLANCDRLDLKGQSSATLHNKLICQLHFHDSQFMNVHTYQRLIWNAVPTLFGKDTRRWGDFEHHQPEVRTDDVYTTPPPLPLPTSAPEPTSVPTTAQSPAQSPYMEQSPELPQTQPSTVASATADPLRHYMLLYAELKREVAEKDNKLRALQKCSDSIVDSVARLVKTLPQEKQQELASSVTSFVQLRGYGRTGAWHEPRVRVEVLLVSQEHPGCTLLGLRTRCSWARGLYMVPGDFLHFGESWETAAVRATRQETGLSLREPRVYSVMETLEASQGHHWVNIFMAGKVVGLGAELTAPKEAVCTGWQWFAWDALPGEELLLWSLRDLRRQNLLDLSALQW